MYEDWLSAKEKKENVFWLTLISIDEVIHRRRCCLYFQVGILMIDGKRKGKLILNANQHDEWSIPHSLGYLYTRILFLFFSLSLLFSFSIVDALYRRFLLTMQKKKEKKSRSFVFFHSPTHIVMWRQLLRNAICPNIDKTMSLSK